MENKMNRPTGQHRGLGLLALLALLVLTLSSRADDFGDLTVSANAMYSGQTFHGYAETRVVLQNHSLGKTHVVTLTVPDRTYGMHGNFISRISRTVKLAPGTREIVSLLQPPLQINGANQIRVEVDGQREGEIRAPNANNHCNTYSRSGQAATVFISRSLDYDAVEQVYHANRGAFTAAMAIGAPDAGGTGYQTACWMPDTRRYNQTNWLELDYATPQIVDKVSVYDTRSTSAGGTIILISAAGTNLARIPMTGGKNVSLPSGGWSMEYAVPTNSGPVKSVRLDFGKSPAYNLSIDAVEIAGPTGTQWAADARASSDNSASAASYAPSSSRTAGDNIQSLRAEAPVSEWSENWLAYTPFDIVALHESDLATMPAAVFGALSDYVAAGGTVVMFGQKKLPAFGAATPSRQLPDGQEYQVGFGRCVLVPTLNLGALSPKTLQQLRETARSEALYWQSLPADSGAANAAMPVVANLKIPTRGLVIIMVIFIVLIGPVNIILLNRRQRRTWMLWTIPAISFATTLLVFAYSLLREGVTPDARLAGLTLLDQSAHRATTIGATAFYCPLTPSGGLRFDYGTEATPLVSVGYGAGTSREVDWSQAQQFQRGWVSARVPAHFHLRKVEARRERLQIIQENGQVKVMNSLGAPIQSLWYADAKMNCYAAHNVAAGQVAGLVPVPAEPGAERSGLGGLLGEIKYIARTDGLTNNATQFLIPNSYVAVLEGNPFLENALGAAARAKRTRAAAVVYGRLETAENNGGTP